MISEKLKGKFKKKIFFSEIIKWNQSTIFKIKKIARPTNLER